MNKRVASILRAVRSAPDAVPQTAFEKHYTAEQLAELWAVHPATVRKWFAGEPGVLRGQGIKRSAIRIPQSVAARKYREMQG